MRVPLEAGRAKSSEPGRSLMGGSATSCDWARGGGGELTPYRILSSTETLMSETAAPDTPTAAGMYDYYLGGTANTPVDRAAAERIKELIPEAVDGAWANRGFLQRAVKRMACEWGIRQFIDIGAGLPTQRSTHEVVAEQRPDGRVVYVDNDPLVIARG